MNRMIKLNAQSYRSDMDDVEGREIQGVTVKGFGNGVNIDCNNLKMRRVEYIGEAGIRLVFFNGMKMEAVELVVMYQS